MLPTEVSARKAASLLRARLSREAGGASDHLATVRAFNGWKAAKAVSSYQNQQLFFIRLLCSTGSDWDVSILVAIAALTSDEPLLQDQPACYMLCPAPTTAVGARARLLRLPLPLPRHHGHDRRHAGPAAGGADQPGICPQPRGSLAQLGAGGARARGAGGFPGLVGLFGCQWHGLGCAGCCWGRLKSQGPGWNGAASWLLRTACCVAGVWLLPAHSASPVQAGAPGRQGRPAGEGMVLAASLRTPWLGCGVCCQYASHGRICQHDFFKLIMTNC